MQPNDIGGLVNVGVPAVSPDGRRVAFAVRRVDLPGNRYVSQVWLHDTAGGSPRPVTSGDKDGSPVWSPDGRALAFTSSRGEKEDDATLHVLPMDGPGEVITIATMREAISDVVWSPDGRSLAFCSRTRAERYEKDKPSHQPPRRITRFFSTLDGVGWTADRPQHLYVVPADGLAAPRNLTPGDFEFAAPSWLADSSGLVASAKAHESWDIDLAQDLYVVPLDGERRALTAQTGMYYQPVAAPDGQRLAFLGADDSLVYPQNVRVGVLDLSSGERRWISTALDRTFEPTGGTATIRWDGDDVFAIAEDRGDSRVYRMPADGSTPPAPVSPAGCMAKSFDLRGGTLAVRIGEIERPDELYVAVGGAGLERVTGVSDAFVAKVRPRPAERFVAPSTDGVEVDGWILTPPDMEDGKRYPVLLNVHGGPHTQYGNTFFDEAQLQAAAGFVVVMGNPRGSSGREETWGQAIMGPNHAKRPGRGWGTVDVDDVLAVLDEALRRYPFCDPDRIGMLGGSYGGYMATWLASHSDRFKAICSERAVNNLLSEEWNSDIATMFRVEHGPRHVDDPDEYLRMSPITFVRDISTPILILHSEDDLRCPITQAEELFVALRQLGKEVEFVRFPAEGHELSRGGSPVHRVQRAEIILEYFHRHL
ncbi:MAG: alpha/beta fold hydrolase [Acidimicrobiia bacterium]